MKLYPRPKQAMRIPVAKPSITALEKEYVYDALAKGDISGVPTLEYIRRFEQAWCERIDREYSFAVTSGTDALEVVLRALGIGAGDEVLIPAWTFAAPINAALYVGATPVLVDIDPENWTIDPWKAAQVRTRHTRAIIAVDIFGHPCDWLLLGDVVHNDEVTRFNFPHCYIIEDAAQAHGAQYKGGLGWAYCGSFGIASTFSLFANKGITTGEGGMILTDDTALAERIALIRNHGMKANYEHELVGGNHRMDNLKAALGVAQMERWDWLLGERERVAHIYNAHLPAELGRRPVSAWAQPATWLYVVTHPERDRIVAGLRDQGIDARPVWKSLDQFDIYADAVRGEYPVSNRVAREAFVLPTFADLDEQTILDICKAVEELL